MSKKNETQKNSKIPIPVIVAIISLIGTIIIALPSFLDTGNILFVSKKNSQSSFVRYDDPSGIFSIEYPSENGIDNREITENEQISLAIMPRNKVSFFDKETFVTTSQFSTLVILCGVSSKSLSNEQVITLTEDVLSDLSYRDTIFITNRKTDDGYYVQYESKYLGQKTFSHVLYKYKDGAYILIHIGSNGDFEFAKSTSEHIISSLDWYPSKVVEFFKNQ